MENNTEIVMYQTEDGKTKIDVHMENDTVWLSQDQMTELFQRDKSTISRHIKNIFDEGELKRESTVANFATVQLEGNRKVERSIEFYNLDVIISVGYRVKSVRGTQFRIWANSILKEYLIKGFVMNDQQLKEMGGGTYWKELLQKIRDIRSSEKVFWRQILDVYATSVDYDPKSTDTILFFKTVQNKIHYAAHRNTAAEIIYNRADSTKPNMGLTNFDGNRITRNDAIVAKNYLTEDELSTLNTLVSAFFDLAELRAKQHRQMFMSDWVKELDNFCNLYGNGALQNAGKISHKKAADKANEEYDKYKHILDAEWSPVEKEYLSSIKEIENKLSK